MRGVADDDDFFAAQRRSERMAPTVAGDSGDVVPVLRVIRKSADVEGFPQPEMAELDFRTEADVSSKQADDRRRRLGLELLEKIMDAGANASAGFAQEMIQPEDVDREKPLEVLLHRCAASDGEHLSDQRNIRASGELNPLGDIRQAKVGSESLGESSHASAVGVQQRAVNVEQDEPD